MCSLVAQAAFDRSQSRVRHFAGVFALAVENGPASHAALFTVCDYACMSYRMERICENTFYKVDPEAQDCRNLDITTFMLAVVQRALHALMVLAVSESMAGVSAS